MKRKLSMVLIGAMALCLVACGDNAKEDVSSNVTASAVGNVEDNAGAVEETTKEGNNTSEITLDALLAHDVTPEEEIECVSFGEDQREFRDYTGTDEILVIPDTYEGKDIVTTSKYSLGVKSSVKAVKFSDSITQIDDFTCSTNEVLEIVVMGAGVKEIGVSAFQSCISLKEVVLNEGLEGIGEFAFSGCDSLTEIYIPSSVNKISDNSFFIIKNNLTIYGEAGSYAEQYANEAGIKFVAQ